MCVRVQREYNYRAAVCVLRLTYVCERDGTAVPRVRAREREREREGLGSLRAAYGRSEARGRGMHLMLTARETERGGVEEPNRVYRPSGVAA